MPRDDRPNHLNCTCRTLPLSPLPIRTHFWPPIKCGNPQFMPILRVRVDGNFIRNGQYKTIKETLGKSAQNQCAQGTAFILQSFFLAGH